jgi:hypothetical protein
MSTSAAVTAATPARAPYATSGGVPADTGAASEVVTR